MASDYLTITDVLGMHHVLIQRYGGAEGVRDMGALEAAIFRPQSGYYEDIITEASALMESLAINHPFVDGNKRVAFAATDVFLRINGCSINESADTAFTFMINLFNSGNFEKEKLEQWLRKVVIE